MRLKEFVDKNGNKVNLPKSGKTPASAPKNTGNNSSAGFKKRLEKLVDYHIDHKNKSVDKIVERYIADYGFIYSEHHGDGIGGYTNKIVMLIDKDENWEYSVFMDDKKLTQKSGKTWEKFVSSISDYLALPLVTSDPDYQELLKEFVDTKGNKVNLKNSSLATAKTSNNNSTAAQVNPLDQTDRYKKLLAKIDSEKNYTYKLKDLSSRILAFVIDFGKSDYVYIRIIFSPRNQTYLVQVVGDDDYRYDSWDEVLKLLVSIRVIKNTYNCESLDISYADDFKLYENLWD
jgi:hypothetical protein